MYHAFSDCCGVDVVGFDLQSALRRSACILLPDLRRIKNKACCGVAAARFLRMEKINFCLAHHLSYNIVGAHHDAPTGVLQSAANFLITMIAGGNHTEIKQWPPPTKTPDTASKIVTEHNQDV